MAEDWDHDSVKPHGLPIRFSNFSIPANDADQVLLSTLGSQLAEVVSLAKVRRWARTRVAPEQEKTFVIDSLDGIVHQGEMLLVVGPPSAHPTAFVRALGCAPDVSLSSDTGLDFGLLTPDQIRHGKLRAEVTYLGQEDAHFAALSLKASLTPAAQAKAPRAALRGESRHQWAARQLGRLTEQLSLGHALKTKVGSSTALGLSGGERKRASVVESLLSDASVLLLDGPTNGLDSSTALRLISFLRAWAVKGKRSVVVTAPHVSDPLLVEFDKVLILDSRGRQIYFGRPAKMEAYFAGLSLGIKRPENSGQGIVEYMLSVISGGANDADLKRGWNTSEMNASLKKDIAAYEARYPYDKCAGPLIDAVDGAKSRLATKSSKYMSSFLTQIGLLTKRQYSLVLAELPTYKTKTAINLAISVLIGTLFFRLPSTTADAFTRGSLLLLSIMFNAYLSLAELGKAIEGRDIAKRQSDYGFFSAAALALARVAGDVPMIGVQVILFGTVTYLLAGLQPSLERFLVYMTFVYATALNLSCLFRMFAAFAPSFEEAIRYCGLTLNVLVIFAGYFIPVRSMRPWLTWIPNIVDPISRSYEAVLANEFRHLALACSLADIVPSGASYTNPRFQTCVLPGSTAGSLVVDGEAYLAASYGFRYDRIWGNLAVMVLQAVAFLVIGVIGTNYLNFAPQGAKSVWARTKKMKRALAPRWRKSTEIDRGPDALIGASDDDAADDERVAHLDLSGSTLSWRELSLFVDTNEGPRQLLDRVSGFVKPGRVCALLGPSGAGKSTLLNVLAGRALGVVKGSIFVDGQVPSHEFYRTTGYVEQFDLHDDKSTVREALEFSALLRQDAALSREDKLAYVDEVLGLLDLVHLEDAIIGSSAAGLSSQARKMLSIAVEVVARPAILFLDEPTTGLDSKSALRVVRLLKKLARTGLAVIATVHQPSAQAFALFDDVLLLQKGGRQLYTGERAKAVRFFQDSRKDADVAEPENPADYLLAIAIDKTEAAQGRNHADTAQQLRWRGSADARRIEGELTALAASGGPSQVVKLASSAPVWLQCVELTRRVSRHYYRDVSYSWTKLFTSTAVPLVVGLSFYQEGRQRSIVSLENRMFSVFLLLFVPVVVMNVTIFKAHQLRALWHAREKPCRVYGRFAFATSLVVSELPYSVACATTYFVIWWSLVGLPTDRATVGYAFGLLQLFWVFQSTWALWIVALSDNLGTIANLLPFFLVSMEAFNGSLMPYSQMPVYWRWLYWVSPFRHYLAGMLGVILHGQPVECDPVELVAFLAPEGQACGQYAAEYLRSHAGYLVDAAAMGMCEFCRAATGDDFLATLHVSFGERWRALGILAAYTASNVGLVYLLVYFPPEMPACLRARLGGNGKHPSAEQAAEAHWDHTMEAERLLEGAATTAFS